MRRIWMLCALMLSLSMMVSAAEAATRSAKSHEQRWTAIKAHHKTKRKTHRRATSQKSALATSAAGSDPVLFGDQNTETGLDSNPAGWAEAFPFTNTTTGSAQSITVYVDSRSRSGTLIAGLYTDSNGHPGTLLASGAKASPVGAAWNAVSIASTAVTAGTKYWVTLLGKSGALYFRDRFNGPCLSENSAHHSLSSLPSTWTSGPTWNTCPLSAYVSGTVVPPPGLLAPSNTASPLVSGNTTQGQTLTTTNGSWSNLPTSYTYAWQDCDTSGNGCTNISGATRSSYALTAADAGHTIRSVVTASNLLGSGTASSPSTATVMPLPPANTALPTLSGTAMQGQTMTTSDGSWSNSPTAMSYAWQDCDSSGSNCSAISGATASSYTLALSDVGHTLRAMVTAGNAGGSASVMSSPSAMVAAPPPPPSPPANTAAPTVSGTAIQGQTLSTSNGSWSNSPTSYKYAWQDCDTSGNNCTTISGASASSYTLAAGDVSHTMRSVVTATNAGGSGSASSAPTAAVATAPPPSPPSNTAAPVVSGTATQGQTLTTSNGSWSNSPTSYKYAWQDCDTSGNNCTTISGASASSYTLAAGDVSHTMRSVVTATNSGGSSSATSSPMGPVVAVASTGPCPVSTPNVPDGPDPWGGCFPGPHTTGVPTGTTLTTYTGPCTITTSNTTISAKTINCDPLTIQATNVQISDSLINGSVHNDASYPNSYSVTVTDSEINTPTNRTELQNGVRGIEKYNFTALRDNIHGGISGGFCEDNCTVQDSYLWGQGNDNNSSLTCTAVNGTQHVCVHESALRDGESPDATKGQLIQHNSLWCSANQYSDPNPGGSDSSGCSADLTGYGDFAPIQNNTIKNNLFVATGTGGTCAYGGSSTGKPYSNQANHDVFQSNVFQHSNSTQNSGHCGVWFASADFSTSAPGNLWAGNTWDNGAPLAANQ